jgi:phosphatidylglycerophosphate synthase
MKILTIPNTLSLFRILFGLLIILQFDSHIKYVYLGIAILLDALDGYAARKLNQVSKEGAVIDAVADRIFVIMLFLFIFFRLNLPAEYFIFFFARDIFTTFGALILWKKGLAKKIHVKDRVCGKVVTALQFATLILLVIGDLSWIRIGMYVLFIVSVISIIDYIIYFRRKNKHV